LKFALARLIRLKQPCVLDGDDGLVGEYLEQLDLFLGTSMRRMPMTPMTTSSRISG